MRSVPRPAFRSEARGFPVCNSLARAGEPDSGVESDDSVVRANRDTGISETLAWDETAEMEATPERLDTGVLECDDDFGGIEYVVLCKGTSPDDWKMGMPAVPMLETVVEGLCDMTAFND